MEINLITEKSEIVTNYLDFVNNKINSDGNLSRLIIFDVNSLETETELNNKITFRTTINKDFFINLLIYVCLFAIGMFIVFKMSLFLWLIPIFLLFFGTGVFVQSKYFIKKIITKKLRQLGYKEKIKWV